MIRWPWACNSRCIGCIGCRQPPDAVAGPWNPNGLDQAGQRTRKSRMTIAAIRCPACRRRLSVSHFAISVSRLAILCSARSKPVSYFARCIPYASPEWPASWRGAACPWTQIRARQARGQVQASSRLCLISLVLVTAGKFSAQPMQSARCRFPVQKIGAMKAPTSWTSADIGLIPASSRRLSGSALANSNPSESH